MSGSGPSRVAQTPLSRFLDVQPGRALEVRKLRKTFRVAGRTLNAVDGVSVSMYPGEIFVLLGHNGAGKTTLISCLTGLLRPTQGKAELFSNDLWKALHTTEGPSYTAERT